MKRIILFAVLLTLMGYLIAQSTVDIRKANDINYEGAYAETSGGGFITVYVDTQQSTNVLHAALFSGAGDPLWATPAQVVVSENAIRYPKIVVGSDNSYVVAWIEISIQGYSVRAQKLDAQGSIQWSQSGNMVFDTTMDIKVFSLVDNSIGGAYLVAQSYNETFNHSLWGANLDTQGQNLWQMNGLALVTNNDVIHISRVLSDGAGGIILNSLKQLAGMDYINHVIRVGIDGNLIGSDPLITDADFVNSHFAINRSLDGNYILHQIVSNNGPRIRFNKVDNQGNILLPGGVEQPFNGSSGTLRECPDGTIYVGCQAYISNNTYEFRVQKFSSDFTAIWAQMSVQQLSSYNTGFTGFTIDAAGNCWYGWCVYGSTAGLRDVRLQKFNADGSLAFGDTGLLVSSNGSTQQPMVHGAGDGAAMIWTNIAGSAISLRRQVISSSGVPLLPAAEEEMVTYTYGSAKLKANLALSDGFVQVWDDYRNYPFSSICYQKTDLQHNQLYEASGRVLIQGESTVSVWEACANSQNEILVAYRTQDNGGYNLHIQIIDSNGFPLYPEGGMQLSAEARFVNVSSDGMDFYISWVGMNDTQADLIMGQRISNGTLMWEPLGRIIRTYTYSNRVNNLDMRGRYIVWAAFSGTDYDYKVVYALLVEPSGNIAAGWDPNGVIVSGQSTNSIQDVGKVGLIDGNLVVVVDSSLPRAQLISPQGARLWGVGTVIMSGADGDRGYIDADINNGISALFYSQNNNECGLYLQRINAEGEIQCSPTGQYLALGDWLMSKAAVIDHGTGTITVLVPERIGSYFYEPVYDIKPYQVSSDGVIQPGQNLNVSVRSDHNCLAAKHSSQTMLAWNDFDYQTISEGYLNSIRGSFISIQSSAIDPDTEIPPAILSQVKAYPNPFAGSTTISYRLGRPGIMELDIYNLRGQKVKSLEAQGSDQLEWDGTDQEGRPAAAGLYLYRLKSGKQVLHGKVLKLK